MEKLKIWQIILLIIFYPVGIVYFLYWLYRTRIYADNPQPPLKQWQIWLYSLVFPIGIVVFIIWLSKTNFCTQDQTGGAIAPETADRCKRYLSITSVALVIVSFLFFGAAIGGDSEEDDSRDREGTFATTTTETPESPETTTKAPETTKEFTTIESSVTTVAPAVTTEPPTTTTESPVTTTESPVTTTESPTTTTHPVTTEPPAPDSALVIVSQWETARRNDIASLTIKGKPNTEYQMRVKYKSGWSVADGLGTKTSDANGYITWDWKIGGRTTFGTWQIEITGDGQKVMSEFTVVE